MSCSAGLLPLHFGAVSATLFGWYHPPLEPSRSCGVVLCNPIGDDGVRAHRPLRHLAERLARCGFAVLRFDFHGTGDSSGDERDADRVGTWLDNIGAAIEQLRSLGQVDEIAGVGLRLGGTLAAVATARAGGIASLVLWNPLDGAGFVTESTRLHKLHKLIEPHGFAAGPQEHPDGQEALGFLLTHSTMAELGGIDLMKLTRRPADHVLLVHPGPFTKETAKATNDRNGRGGPEGRDGQHRRREHLEALGAVVEGRHIDGPKFLTQPPHRALLPEQEIDAIVSWLAERHPSRRRQVAPPAPLSASVPGSALADEQPLFFGRRQSLFGIWVRPPRELTARRRRADVPAILMLNAGTVHRIGPHRSYVTLSRRWARLGFHVLRLDLSGIGDSAVGPGCEENLCYPSSAPQDIDQAMEALAGQTGATRFILMGLCSGGDHAFSQGLAAPRVAGALMMNPRTFCVNDPRLVSSYHYARYYRTTLFRRRSWRRLVEGHIDLRRVVARIVPRLTDLLRTRLGPVVSALRPGSGPAVPDIPACLRLMAGRGVDAFLLVTENDPGVAYVDAHFGEDMAALAGVAGFRREDIPGTDHTFTSLWAQKHVADMITDHLIAHHLGPSLAC